MYLLQGGRTGGWGGGWRWGLDRARQDQQQPSEAGQELTQEVTVTSFKTVMWKKYIFLLKNLAENAFGSYWPTKNGNSMQDQASELKIPGWRERGGRVSDTPSVLRPAFHRRAKVSDWLGWWLINYCVNCRMTKRLWTRCIKILFRHASVVFLFSTVLEAYKRTHGIHEIQHIQPKTLKKLPLRLMKF